MSLYKGYLQSDPEFETFKWVGKTVKEKARKREYCVGNLVASATTTFVIMFSSSLSVVEFYLLKRFPIPYALYLMSVSNLAGFWGQFFVRKLVAFLKRASLIVFILSAVIFASTITMGMG
ncbi:transmembrane protein TauE-like protein [Artemisia annua]|uniref:Transmembrane protein TauE-like protein n=1 Tax=Artemisia annua TaxID=35608 RepID=A0A2U1MVI7_ARTAN|nr:transmembrane protein TauE-like protein [Artemisia annua]